jgi:signal transduction histidine kinase
MEHQQLSTGSKWMDRPISAEIIGGTCGGSIVAFLAFIQQRFIIELDVLLVSNLIVPFIAGGFLGTLVAYFIRQSRRLLLENLKVERQAAETAYHDIEDKLATAIESVSDGFLLIDSDDRIVLTNARFRNLYPNSHDLIQNGAKFEDFLRGGAARGEFLAAVDNVNDWVARRMTETAKKNAVVEDHLIGDRWVRAASQQLPNGGRVSIHVDFTERVNNEKALRESQERLSDYAGSASDWFWEIDENLRFVLITDSIMQYNGGIDPSIFYGMTRQELNVRHNVDPSHWTAHIEDLKARRPFKNFEYGFIDSDGNLHEWSISGRPFQNIDGAFCGYRGVGRDITDRVFAQNEINRQHDELDLLNQQKNKFFSILAHDLKNPFNVMMGYAKIIDSMADKLSREKMIDMARSISVTSHNLYQLLEDLLAWGQSQMGTLVVTKEVISSKEIFESGVKSLRDVALSKNIVIELQPNGIEFYVDREMIVVVVRNLVSNAIKFTPSHGHILLKAETTTNPVTDGGLVISIIDTGVGMSKEQTRKLFHIETNQSTRGTDGESGTGLGLLLCKEFVEKQGGQINVVSKEGKGTTFSIVFPLPPTGLEQETV